MTKKQLRALRRNIRVRQFLTTNQVEGTSVKLRVLDRVIREMSESGEEQDASKRLTHGEVARQAGLRTTLWSRHMVPIARIARRAFGVPGMDQKFALPPKRADNEGILNAARGMLQAAEEHSAVFVHQEGLPADFTQQLRSSIEELASVLSVRVAGQTRRKTSGQTIEALVKTGNAAIEVLDAIVSPRLIDRPDLLATWKSEKRPIEPGGNPGISAEPDIAPVGKVA